MKLIDISKIKTLNQLEKIKWDKYCSKDMKTWVKFIASPVAQKDLDNICHLAEQSNVIRMGNHMGELYYIKRI